MVSVQMRLAGEGTWRPMGLPLTAQAAQTVADAARRLDLADEVRIRPAGAPALRRVVDVRI